MKLTKYFIQKKVQSLASEAARRKHESCALENARNILILCQADDWEAVDACLASLRKQQKQVQTCVYLPGNNIQEIAGATMVIQAKTDLNSCYIPLDPVVEQFKSLKADILIDLTHADCYPMQYLLLQHPSGYRVGAKHQIADLYDLAISVTDSEDIKQLFGHILFYLQTIRSK